MMIVEKWYLEKKTYKVLKDIYHSPQAPNTQFSSYLGRNRVFGPFLIFLCYNSLSIACSNKERELIQWLQYSRYKYIFWSEYHSS